MILIISEAFDSSTTNVIEWLDFLEKKWIRINAQNDLELNFIGNDVVFKTQDTTFKLSEISSCWYRRGYLPMKNSYKTGIAQFDNLQVGEFDNVVQFIYYKLKKKKHLNSFYQADVNKLIANDIASELGILVPSDLIFSNAQVLKNELSASSKDFITKVMSGNCMQKFQGFTIYNYTKDLITDNIPDDFFPSLVQDKIAKKYELRIFYLDNKFYSMAILSQSDPQTNVDFRNYNNEKPNRTVPYKLPEEIEDKLSLLMNKLDVNCGSIDMIVTPKHEYVFLEVNPVGQFGMVSHPCNYELENKIAQFL
ncbi:grasp-with-spasm system ATP-grasp peptide maturase [Flavobacterium sp. LS1R49]|uniref:Grasp-with-spasm system ATP-grasp peptide maturase n=1 Tax=Flavobacterium shii TaxID=2987687 RepID=A0A9X2ZBM9_9FLAO|nr:grasp-with-spasm system ATP-grasp peptide maturase [Flavobacterium shii]MCV9926265.1 grasp-with-spasm system ATP-grasp peptide maturase [Flavobacterium shii]